MFATPGLGQFVLLLFISINFVLMLGGLSLAFGAAENDADAPWAGQVTIFLFAMSGIAVLLAAGALGWGVYMRARGHPAILLAASIGGLTLPVLVSMAYLWYLRNVAEGTISGPVGIWLLVFNSALVMLAVGEAVAVVTAEALRRASRDVDEAWPG